jgi:hypothetical protein
MAVAPTVAPGEGLFRRAMAESRAPAERCMYRIVIVRLEWPASSWIAFAGAPRIAKCEQNECRNLCIAPKTVRPARR